MDSTRRGASKNGSTNGAATTRKPSTRVKNEVNYDVKQAFKDLTEDSDAKPNGDPNSGLTELQERVNDLSESWETESLLQDALEDLAEDRFFTDGEFSVFHNILPVAGEKERKVGGRSTQRQGQLREEVRANIRKRGR
jgi:hypothetical protein